ncbi:hypothetical protein [Actinorugispora endophytica]|uniref:Mce-associated membrane protein n=1 Tax=Actinorugispora endophytica TaxID=1605990 RepID=A0A4R6V320_9ACTN|nr:hypothetical protein [Actinorugispora endophytica]TDQ54785.1 hypothetical protein EV190_101101 [Actinorugispora endophytica]
MPKPLSDGAQRLVFGVLVVALVAFGIYWSVGGFGPDDQEDPQEQEQEAVESGEGGADGQPVAPIPTTAAEDMALADWLPFSEDEFKAAAATAQAFAEAYGTIDYSDPPETYYDRLGEYATEEYADTLAQSSGAGALWGEREEEEAVSTGRADVRSIRSFDEDSVVFVLRVQSVTEGNDGETQNLGDFAVTMIGSGQAWEVFDFQPADAGNFGEG